MTPVRTWALSNEMAMPEAFVYPWEVAGQRFARSRTQEHDFPRFRRSLRVLLILGLLAAILGVLGSPRPSPAANPDAGENKIVVPEGPLDFETCARLAIQQSPYLTKSSIEIELRKMDENDSRYAMFPMVTFRTYYYINRPEGVNFVNQGDFISRGDLTPRPYSLNFTTDPYNPFGAYFTLQAQKIVTKMAVFSHLQIVSEGLQRVGKQFLDMAALKRLAAHQSDLVGLSQENLTYAQNRQSIGTGTSLEVRVATQELELAKKEKERLDTARKRITASLKVFLGLKPEQQVDFDLRSARHQVLGNFDPAVTALEQAKSRSYELKTLELRQELQKYSITLAKTRVLPTFLFTTQSPDPLSLTSGKGLYVGLGLELPVWDGFKRIRNISRQKAILKQFDADKDLKEGDFGDKWNALREDLQSAAAALKIAQSQEELARLKERQCEIRYQSGGEPLPTWLEGRKANLEAQKNVTSKAMEYDEIILNLRQLSGDLSYTYVDPKSWQK